MPHDTRPASPATTMPHPERPPSDASDYGAEQMQHLSRPGARPRAAAACTSATPTARGLHHLVYEVVDNSIDEAMAGYAKNVCVTINVDGSVTVEDDGRGIPVERTRSSPRAGPRCRTLRRRDDRAQVRRQVRQGAYQTSGGLHGVGVTVVNFLSEWCEVEVRRDGHVYQQEYERGVPTGRRAHASAPPTSAAPRPPSSPTRRSSRPPSSSTTCCTRRLQELAFLNRGVRIVFKDERTGEGETFHYERGIVEFVEHLNRASEPLHADVIYVAGEQDGVGLEIALQYTTEYTENVHSYVNNINTIEGGTHVSGFRTALTRTLNNYGKKDDLFKDLTPTGDDFREGLTAVISRPRAASRSSKARPRPSSATAKSKASSTRVVGDFLAKYLEENPKTAKIIVQKGHARRRGPRGRPQGQGTCSASAKAPWPAAACPASSATAPAATSTSASCTWSRAIPPAAAPKAAACASTRRSCRCGARSSTPTSRAKTRCWPTKKSAA